MIPEQIRNLIPSRTKRAASAAFTTTHWSVVLAAQHKSPPAAAAAALEELCRCYWRPIYSFVRRQGAGREDAEDLTQAFFARLLDLRGFEALRQEKGRLRSYLLVSLKHFLETEQRRAMAVKRGEGRKPVPLEILRANERVDIEPRDALSADLVYERRWALTVLERVLARLRSEYQTANRLLLFTRLSELLAGEPDRPSQADTDQLDYFCSMTNNVHGKSSTSLQGRSKDFADYASRRSNACRVVLRSARVLDVSPETPLARSPIPTGTPNPSTRVR